MKHYITFTHYLRNHVTERDIVRYTTKNSNRLAAFIDFQSAPSTLSLASRTRRQEARGCFYSPKQSQNRYWIHSLSHYMRVMPATIRVGDRVVWVREVNADAWVGKHFQKQKFNQRRGWRIQVAQLFPFPFKEKAIPTLNFIAKRFVRHPPRVM